jgi:hypothetical protein
MSVGDYCAWATIGCNPQAVFHATWPPRLLRRAGVETTEDGVVRPDVCHGGPNKFFAA